MYCFSYSHTHTRTHAEFPVGFVPVDTDLIRELDASPALLIHLTFHGPSHTLTGRSDLLGLSEPSLRRSVITHKHPTPSISLMHVVDWLWQAAETLPGDQEGCEGASLLFSPLQPWWVEVAAVRTAHPAHTH